MVKLNTFFVSLALMVFMAVSFLAMPTTAQAQTGLAQSLPTDYSPTAKTLYIDLARAGDAESLYQLGLMHFHGLGASKNDKVARSFFKHASDQGHNQARQILIVMAPPVVMKPVVKTKPITDSVSKNLKPARAKDASVSAAKVKEKAKAERQQAIQAKREALKAERQAAKAERQAAVKAKREAARKAKQAAKRAANKARQHAIIQARQDAAMKKNNGSTRLQIKESDSQEKAINIPAESTDDETVALEPHSQNFSNKSKTSSTPSPTKPTAEKAGFGGLLKGLLTATLLLTMFVAMVLMGRCLRS